VRLRPATRQYRGAGGEVLSDSIAEDGYRRLGGLEQWVMIRGESVSNPPLILLHGGPGFSETRFFRLFNASLEKHFTVVYWDQRGAGRSFSGDIPRSSMTVEQFVADLDQLVDAVCQRLGKTEVAIFGHSWGSALGVLYADRFPHKVAVYVGSGQYGDAAAGEAASYAFGVAEARRRGKRTALKKLRDIGPPPHTPEQLMVERTVVTRLEGGMRPAAWPALARIALGVRESSIIDLPRLVRGFRFSLDAMWAEASRLNLLELAPALDMPVFFFLGRNDHWVPPDVSAAYYDVLSAPAKQIVWFERSGHEPFADEPGKFNAAMAELVRPLLAPEPALGRRQPAATASSRSRLPLRRLGDAARLAVVLATAPRSWRPVRPLDSEPDRPLPGDDIVAGPDIEWMHGVTIRGRARDVWPWLVQMGCRRAGWYSYDGLDNGAVPSAARIVPELQRVEVGDVLPWTPTATDGFVVRAVEPERALVLGDPDGTATWALVLEPLDKSSTRLLVRARAICESRRLGLMLRFVWRPIHFGMQRRQLLNVKQRVETAV
jgi:pimeloyl-ACP methyl ester carboxylesterase